MTIYEHAQQIYTALLAARVGAGQPVPPQNEQPRHAALALDLAKVFAKTNGDGAPPV